MKQRKIWMAGLLSMLLVISCVSCGAQNVSAHSDGVFNSSSAVGQLEIARPQAGSLGDLPAAENGYMVKEPMGEEVRLDLDGDGESERVTVTTKEVQRKYGENSGKETVISSFVINGKEYIKSGKGETYSLNVPNVIFDTPERNHYFITDLETSDSALEIALLDYGPSNDRTTTYLRYQEGQLISLGTIEGFPDDPESALDGAGKVKTLGRLGLLQTWYAPFLYQLKGAVLEKAPQAWYTPVENEGQNVILKKELILYDQPDRNVATKWVIPSEEPVTFPSTDNKHWVQLRLADGTEGWFYMEDSSTIRSGNQTYMELEAFDNLNMTD